MVEQLKPFGVGSLPWSDPLEAIAHVQRYYGSAPFVPQLPLRGVLSQMVVEPFQRYRSHFDSTRGGTILKGSLDTLVNLSELRVSERLDAAPRTGVVDFDECFAALSATTIPSCKLQLIGPATLFKHLSYGGRSLGECPEAVAIYALYIEEMEFRLSRVLELTTEVTVVFDEPSLPYLGRNELTAALKRLARLGAMVRERGAQFGVHCCGSLEDPGVQAALQTLNLDLLSTPWFLSSPCHVDVELKALIRPDGVLALGVFPTDGSISEIDLPPIVSRLRTFAGGDTTLAVSASCGLAFVGEDNAEAVGRAISQLVELFSA